MFAGGRSRVLRLPQTSQLRFLLSVWLFLTHGSHPWALKVLTSLLEPPTNTHTHSHTTHNTHTHTQCTKHTHTHTHFLGSRQKEEWRQKSHLLTELGPFKEIDILLHLSPWFQERKVENGCFKARWGTYGVHWGYTSYLEFQKMSLNIELCIQYTGGVLA